MSKKDTDIDDKGTLTITYREDDGEVDRRRLAGIMGAATSAMMVLLIVTFSLGMVGAALGVGLGGFVANFDKVSTEGNASIYPVLGEQAACENAPQLEANLGGTAEITSDNNGSSTPVDAPAVEFFKDVPLPGLFDTAEFARITIAGNGTEDNPIEAEDLTLRLTALEADALLLGNASDDFTINRRASIAEFNSTDGDAEDAYAYNDTAGNMTNQSQISPSDTIADMSDQVEFGIDAKGFVIESGTAAAHQVAFDGINLQDVNLAVQILNNTSTQNAVVNPSSPTDNGCDSLVQSAQLDDQPDNLGEDTDLTTSSGGIQLNATTDVDNDSDVSPRSDEFSDP